MKKILALSTTVALLATACGPSYPVPPNPYVTIANASGVTQIVDYTINGKSASMTLQHPQQKKIDLSVGDVVCISAAPLNQRVTFTTKAPLAAPNDYSVYLNQTLKIERPEQTFTVETGTCTQ